jgi:kumamolisin
LTRDSSSGYTPQELRAAYNLSSLSGSGLDGSNQTIALAEWGDFAQSDIDTYDREFGLSTATPERISVPFNGQQAHTGPGQDEVELDIEVLHAIAPKAHLLVYVSPQTNGAGLAQANRMVTDDRASIVSVSWGFPDAIAPTGVLAAIDQVLAEGAAQGQAVLVASGDAGAFDDANAPSTPIVDYPSSDPFVTAVGGTSLSASSGGYGSESVWGNHSSKSGSGGGLSLYFKRPWYQSGPGVVNRFSSTGARQTPDVAADADPDTGYRVFVTSKGQTGWGDYGGTSASTPLWAGYIALVQQKLGRHLGFLNPLLYQMGQQSSSLPAPPYHDITTGDNLYYSATPGWDFGTGWGSMNGANMLQDIQQIENK